MKAWSSHGFLLSRFAGGSAGPEPEAVIARLEDEGGAGSDPSMMRTTCERDEDHWIVNGRKAFITGARGAAVGIIMARAAEGACLFLVDLPDPAVRIERVLDTIDSSMPGGHSIVAIENLRIPAGQMLGTAGEGFSYAQIRLSPARLSHCMRWHGAARRCQEIASVYACKRYAFGKPLIDHEGVGFMLAESRRCMDRFRLADDHGVGRPTRRARKTAGRHVAGHGAQ